jgi:hypothetical protein
MALMPPLAPIVVLLFLGAIAGMMLAAAILAYAFVRKLRVVRRWAAIALVAIPTGYATLLFADSLKSRDRILEPGAKKYFCEIDCHLAYSVERVERAKTLGAMHARGTFTVVTLKTWFDESTTSPMRPREAPLYPNPRQVYMADESGRRFPRSNAAERELGRAGVASTPLSRPLVPGESYSTTLVFDLPEDARGPRLFVGDADPVSSFLIFHEQGPLHGKIWFGIR